uniref:Kinesin light chain n=1 Tax=Prasinoderma coloniale TaxID=156133 RepID=A0A7R9TJX7_9VIRI|mmetsp:Transcript_2251/g.8954  ORF Transcript_2251/g.8954 Transcript_2251/m.8954 type:complete len:566 (+) Transcript_2251:1-1698(+)
MATLHAKNSMPTPVARKRGHDDGAEAGVTNEGAAKIPEGTRRVAPLPARPPRGTVRCAARGHKFSEGEVENMLIYIFKAVPLSCYEANPACMYSEAFWRGAIEANFIAEGRTATSVAQFARRVLKGYVEKHYDDSEGKKPETALRTRKRKTSAGPAPTQAPHSKPGKRTRRAKSTQPSRFERNVSGQEVLAPAEAVDSHAQAQLEALQQELREATLAKSEAERRLRAERAQSDRRAIRDARTLASLDAEQRRTKAELAKVRAALLLHAPHCPEALSDGTCARTMRWPYVPGARAARARGEEPASGQGDEQLRQGPLASLEEVLRLLRAEAEPSNEAIANTLDYIGEVQERQGALDPALASYEEVLRLRRAAVKKPSDGAIAAALENIGFVQGKLGALETARKKHQEALDIRRKALGDDHPRVALSLLNISDACNKMGRHDEALAAAEESMRISRAALPFLASAADVRDVRHNLGIAINNAGEALHGLGRFDEAIAKCEEALDVYAVVGLRDDHEHPTQARDLLGRAKRGEGPECFEGGDSGQDEEQATDGATPCAVEPVEQVLAQ